MRRTWRDRRRRRESRAGRKRDGGASVRARRVHEGGVPKRVRGAGSSPRRAESRLRSAGIRRRNGLANRRSGARRRGGLSGRSARTNPQDASGGVPPFSGTDPGGLPFRSGISLAIPGRRQARPAIPRSRRFRRQRWRAVRKPFGRNSPQSPASAGQQPLPPGRVSAAIRLVRRNRATRPRNGFAPHASSEHVLRFRSRATRLRAAPDSASTRRTTSLRSSGKRPAQE